MCTGGMFLFQSHHDLIISSIKLDSKKKSSQNKGIHYAIKNGADTQN